MMDCDPVLLHIARERGHEPSTPEHVEALMIWRQCGGLIGIESGAAIERLWLELLECRCSRCVARERVEAALIRAIRDDLLRSMETPK